MNGHVTFSQRGTVSTLSKPTCRHLEGTYFLTRKESSLVCPKNCRRPLLISCRRSYSSTRADPPLINGRRPSSPPRQPLRQPPAVREKLLTCSQVVDKQVITRTSGLQLGIISNFLVDTRTVTAAYLQLRAKGLGGEEIGVIPLSALTQIADVVLVHDESVVEDELRSRGLAKLVGYSVQAYDGTPLGKVRNFTFSPDTGRITHLNYDTFGLPSIPEALLNVYEVEMEAVLEVRSGLVVLKRGAERAAVLVSSGLLGYALDKAKDVYDAVLGSESREVYLEGMDKDFIEWRLQHGAEWARYYNLRELPESRAQVDAVTRRTQNTLPPPRETAQLLSRDDSPRYSTRDPRTRRVPQSAAQLRQQPAASTSASVPIIDTRPQPPYRRRDADGRYGEQPARPQQQAAQNGDARPGVPFDEFVVREPAPTRVAELEAYDNARERPTMASRRSRLSADPYTAYPGPPQREQQGWDAAEQTEGRKMEDDGNVDKGMRLEQIRQDLSDWRLQKREMDEVYQYGDKGAPRMRRH